MLERLGIADELAARRKQFSRYAYVAPEDRLARMEPPKPAVVEPSTAPVPVPPKLRLNYKSAGGGGHGGGHPVEDMEGMTAKVRDVLTVFAEMFDVDVSDILSASRKKKHVRPRQAVSHYLSCKLKLSFHSIGNILRRDHSSAFEGTYKAEVFIATDLSFHRRYEQGGRILRELWAARYHAQAKP